ncbi:hypothetical protein SeMB42_g07494 [Synchytrium endobioticum]|uniref:Uncharacterized protein n=1 Tax=Synchytrium endobioticum TaxID=286115 RepID=A0A507BX82_9FUNG|nr:hypothetical protein SeMB42_g07494 [Synchytrium endobioticum]TPX46539.1 hypothetical protein SeLEV6574_g03180 [Synchytrium endobioticum]
MLQLYVTEATMQPATSCTASCINPSLPSALVRSSAAQTQSRINHDSLAQFFKTTKSWALLLGRVILIDHHGDLCVSFPTPSLSWML